MRRISAANRNPAVNGAGGGPDPDTFVPDRYPNRHLALSTGHHHCQGADFARAEPLGRTGLGPRRLRSVGMMGRWPRAWSVVRTAATWWEQPAAARRERWELAVDEIAAVTGEAAAGG